MKKTEAIKALEFYLPVLDITLQPLSNEQKAEKILDFCVNALGMAEPETDKHESGRIRKRGWENE